MGVKAPGVCPTCGVDHAYVEIGSQEAGEICGMTASSLGRDEFLRAIHAFARDQVFMVSRDEKKVAMLLDGIFQNEKNHGLKYCPCRMICKEPEEDLRQVCPCNFLIHETYQGLENGECWCGLFVRRKKDE